MRGTAPQMSIVMPIFRRFCACATGSAGNAAAPTPARRVLVKVRRFMRDTSFRHYRGNTRVRGLRAILESHRSLSQDPLYR